MLDAKVLKPPSLMQTETAYRERETGPRPPELLSQRPGRES